MRQSLRISGLSVFGAVGVVALWAMFTRFLEPSYWWLATVATAIVSLVLIAAATVIAFRSLDALTGRSRTAAAFWVIGLGCAFLTSAGFYAFILSFWVGPQ